MDTVNTKLEFERILAKSGKIRAFLLYEDASTSARAKDFCGLLWSEPQQAPMVQQHAWFFNELKSPRLRQIAAEEAALSDLLLISVHHADCLPNEVEDWLKRIRELKAPRTGLLVALLDPVYSGDSSSLQAHLEQFALEAGLQFFAHADDLPDTRSLI